MEEKELMSTEKELMPPCLTKVSRDNQADMRTTPRINL
jgi:hypothetical protein